MLQASAVAREVQKGMEAGGLRGPREQVLLKAN